MRFSLIATLVAFHAFTGAAFNVATDQIQYQNSGNKGHFTQNKPGIGVTTPQEYASVDTFQEGDLINITWTTVFPVFDVVVLQPTVKGGANIGILSPNVSDDDISSYPWSASRTALGGGEGDPIGNMYYFMIRNSSNVNDFFTSSFFNVTKASNNKPSSTTSASATMTPTAGAGLAPPSASTTAASAASPSANPGSSGPSGGAIAGIVIGVLAGVALVAGAVWRLWWVPRQRKVITAATVNPPPDWTEKAVPPKWAPYEPSRDGHAVNPSAAAGPTTVPGHDAVHEVDATPLERGPQEMP